MAGVDRAQLVWPVSFTPDGTGLTMVEQDSDDDVASCMATILLYPLGGHPSDPNFGVADQAFLQGGANLAEIKAAIVQSEPRAADLGVMQDDSQLATWVAAVTIGFTARALTEQQ